MDQAAPARHYFSDGFASYAQLMYPGKFQAVLDKSQTYAVEADNAELRHYLARLGRRSRCFSRDLWALARAVDLRAVDLFVYAWNRRQVQKRKHPRLPAHVCDFIADRCETLPM